MKNIKLFKVFEESHWADDIVVEYERVHDIKGLLYDFIDIGKVDVETFIGRSDYSRNLGRISDYMNFNLNLFKSYRIVIGFRHLSKSDIETIIEMRDSEITLLKRLQEMGFEMKYEQNHYQTIISLRHPDDVIDKKIFIPESTKGKDILEEVNLTLIENFSKIANIYKYENNIEIKRKQRSSKYNLEETYVFIRRSLFKYGHLIEIKLYEDLKSIIIRLN